jgi:hypothetical protein
VWRNGQSARLLGAAEDVGPHFAHAEPGAATRFVRPAIAHFPVVSHRQRGQRLAGHFDGLRERGIEPHEEHEHRIGDEHRIEPPGKQKPQDPQHGNDARHGDGSRCPQHPRDRAQEIPQQDEAAGDGADDGHRAEVHAVGASMRSRIAVERLIGG